MGNSTGAAPPPTPRTTSLGAPLRLVKSTRSCHGDVMYRLTRLERWSGADGRTVRWRGIQALYKKAVSSPSSSEEEPTTPALTGQLEDNLQELPGVLLRWTPTESISKASTCSVLQALEVRWCHHSYNRNPTYFELWSLRELPVPLHLQRDNLQLLCGLDSWRTTCWILLVLN